VTTTWTPLFRMFSIFRRCRLHDAAFPISEVELILGCGASLGGLRWATTHFSPLSWLRARLFASYAALGAAALVGRE